MTVGRMPFRVPELGWQSLSQVLTSKKDVASLRVLPPAASTVPPAVLAKQNYKEQMPSTLRAASGDRAKWEPKRQ